MKRLNILALCLGFTSGLFAQAPGVNMLNVALSTPPSIPGNYMLAFDGAKPVGQFIAMSDITGGSIGTTGGGWSIVSGDPTLLHTKVSDVNLTRRTPVRIGGKVYYGSGGKGMTFDLTYAKQGNHPPHPAGQYWETFLWAPPGNELPQVSVSIQMRFGLNSAAGGNAIDHLTIYAGSYVVLQQQQLSDESGTNQGALVMHGQLGGTSTRGRRIYVDYLRHYSCTLKPNFATGMGELMVFDGVTGEFIGASQAATSIVAPIVLFIFGDYLIFDQGRVDWDNVVVDYTNAAMPHELGVVIPPVKDIYAEQTASGAATVGWRSGALTFKVERYNGTIWEIIAAAYYPSQDLNNDGVPDQDAPPSGFTTYTDTTVADGTSYGYRVTPSAFGYVAATASVSNSVAINNATFPSATDSFDTYAGFIPLADTVPWVASGDSEMLTVKTSGDTSLWPNVTGSIYYDSVTPNANHRVEVTMDNIKTVGGFDYHVGPSVRNQTGAKTFYELVANGTGSGNVLLRKCIAGTYTTIATATATVVTGTQLALEAVGTGSATRLTAQVNNGAGWVAISGMTSVDPGGTYINGGKGGVAGVSPFGGDPGDNRIDGFKLYNK